MKLAGHVARIGASRCVDRVLVGKPVGKRSLVRRRCRWEDNIKKALQDVGCGNMAWVEVTQGRDRWQALVNGVMNLRIL